MAVTERDVQLAWQDQQRRQQVRPHPIADIHGIEQQFGQQGVTMLAPLQAILVITKRCRLVEWTLDSTLVGTAAISLSWAAWATPRVWTDMIGSGTAPSLAGASNNASTTLTGWNPINLERRDALLIQVTTALNIEQLTLVLYMHELPRTGLTLAPTP